MVFPLIPLFAGGLAGFGLAGGGGVASPAGGAGGVAGGVFEVGTNKIVRTITTTNAQQTTFAPVTTINREFTFQNITGGSTGTLEKQTSLRPAVSIAPTQAVIPTVASPAGNVGGGGGAGSLLLLGAVGVGAFFLLKGKKGRK